MTPLLSEKLGQDVEDLLDDPHGVLGTDAHEIMLYLQRRQDLAQEVGLGGINELIARAGTGYEFTRLMDIIARARFDSGMVVT